MLEAGDITSTTNSANSATKQSGKKDWIKKYYKSDQLYKHTCKQIRDAIGYKKGLPIPSKRTNWSKVYDQLKKAESLNLSGKGIVDLRPLSSFNKLKLIVLTNNHIHDVTPLSMLTNLERIELGQNPGLRNIDPLLSLEKIESIVLDEDQRAVIDPSGRIHVVANAFSDHMSPKNKMFEVSVYLSPSYSASLLTIEQTKTTLHIPIEDGTRTWTSPFQSIGNLRYFRDPTLEAAVRVTYNYDSLTDTITLIGNDIVSPTNSTCLITRPRNVNDQCAYQHTYIPDPYPCGSNENWNYTTSLTPGLATAFSNSIRQTNDEIIAAAKENFSVVRVSTTIPLMAPEDQNEWTEMISENGEVLGPFDESKEYPPGTTHRFIVDSQWGGEVYFGKNEAFANVIGSTGDPKIASKTWIQLWNTHYGVTANICTSHNWASGAPFACNDANISNIYGGHIIEGTAAKVTPYGSNSVYIIPICNAHNSNDTVYMRADKYQKGIWLKNYHN